MQLSCEAGVFAEVDRNLCAAIYKVRNTGDSCGGEVTCVVRNAPTGLGSPVFDKLEAELAKAVMSLPASKVSIHYLIIAIPRTSPHTPDAHCSPTGRAFGGTQLSLF